jgi:hypothetical protein
MWMKFSCQVNKYRYLEDRFVLVPVAVILVLTAEIRLEPGVLGATEQRKQLNVVTDASEGVYRPTIVLGNLTTASGRPSNDARLTLQMSHP